MKYILLLVLTASLLALVGLRATAMTVQVPLELNENSTMIQTLVEARKQAFGQAVTQEALKLLPAPLDPARQALLEEFLMDRAADFVLSYKNAGAGLPGEEPILTLDLIIDEPGLEKLLRNLGLYSTILGSTPFSLVTRDTTDEEDTSDIPPEGLLELSLLQTLSGLRQEPGASPVLSLRHADKLWSASLVSASGDILSMAQSESLENLWITIWGPYFSGMEQNVSAYAEADLTVSGWYAPDGAEDFQRALRSWDAAVRSARLRDLVVAAQGVTATWRVELTSWDRLVARLEGYLPQRHLTYELSETVSVAP